MTNAEKELKKALAHFGDNDLASVIKKMDAQLTAACTVIDNQRAVIENLRKENKLIRERLHAVIEKLLAENADLRKQRQALLDLINEAITTSKVDNSLAAIRAEVEARNYEAAHAGYGGKEEGQE